MARPAIAVAVALGAIAMATPSCSPQGSGAATHAPPVSIGAAREAMPLDTLLPEWEASLRRLLERVSDDGLFNGRPYGGPYNLFDYQMILPAAVLYAMDHPKNGLRGDPWLKGKMSALADAIDRGTTAEGFAADSSGGRVIDQRLCMMTALAAERLEKAEPALAARIDAVSARISAALVREKLAPARSLTRIDASTVGTSTNHFMLYAAAVLLEARRSGDRDRELLALDTFRRVTACMHPAGYFEEHRAGEAHDVGPTVSYNTLTLNGVAVWYALTGEAAALECLRKGLLFNSSFTLPDMRFDDNLNERVNAYNKVFHWIVLPALVTPGWRRYGLAVLERCPAARGEDLATAMMPLCLGAVREPAGAGDAIPFFRDEYRLALEGVPAGVVRRKPWYVSLNALPDVTWKNEFKDNCFALDRTTFVTVFHDSVGVIIDGSNTKNNPDGYTFVPAGEPGGFHHSGGRISLDDLSAAVDYPSFKGRIRLRLEGERRCVLELSTEGDAKVEANILIVGELDAKLVAGGEERATGRAESFELAGVDSFRYRGFSVTSSRKLVVRWPFVPWNPYGGGEHRQGPRQWRLRLTAPVEPGGTSIAFEVD